MPMKKPQPPFGQSGGGLPVPQDDELFATFPSLLEFLLLPHWPGTTEPRQHGSFLIFVQDQKVKVMLRDYDADAVCFVAGSSLYEALQAADRVVSEGRGDWRPNGGGGARGKRRGTT